jgi:adenylyltransferase/sulfurtransferase
MPTTDPRYSRQRTLAALGEDGQARLAAARVLIVGAGGLGSPAALYLASTGIGHITINDFDNVDLTNLHRQILFRASDIDAPKTAVAAARLRDVNPALECVPVAGRLDDEGLRGLVARADVVLDCTDNFASRWSINRICAEERVNLVSGSAIRLEGQLAVFRHADGKGPCYRCLYADADENLNDCAGQGILPPVAGTIGTMMATETIKLILDMDSDLAGKLWIYDAATGSSRLVTIPVRDDCPVGHAK